MHSLFLWLLMVVFLHLWLTPPNSVRCQNEVVWATTWPVVSYPVWPLDLHLAGVAWSNKCWHKKAWAWGYLTSWFCNLLSGFQLWATCNSFLGMYATLYIATWLQTSQWELCSKTSIFPVNLPSLGACPPCSSLSLTWAWSNQFWIPTLSIYKDRDW